MGTAALGEGLAGQTPSLCPLGWEIAQIDPPRSSLWGVSPVRVYLGSQGQKKSLFYPFFALLTPKYTPNYVIFLYLMHPNSPVQGTRTGIFAPRPPCTRGPGTVPVRPPPPRWVPGDPQKSRQCNRHWRNTIDPTNPLIHIRDPKPVFYT